MERRIRHIEHGAGIVELDAVCAERRCQASAWTEQRAVRPDGRYPAVGADLPDDAVKRIGDVGVAEFIEG